MSTTCSVNCFDKIIAIVCLLFSESPMLNLRTDDIYLTRFLNCCDWNVNDAFNRMTKLFKLKVSVIVSLKTVITADLISVSTFSFLVRESKVVFQQKAQRV